MAVPRGTGLSDARAVNAAAALGRCPCGSYLGLTLAEAPNGSLYVAEGCAKVLAGGSCPVSLEGVSHRRVSRARPSGSRAIDSQALGLDVTVPPVRSPLFEALRSLMQSFFGAFGAFSRGGRRAVG